MAQPHPNSIGNNFRTETHGNQTLHVRENSDTALEDLFSVVNNPNPRKQSDWEGRKLPTSFFHPPQHAQNRGNHSRNGSQDSTPYIVQHTRSRSAPVQTLQQSLSLPQQPPPPQHVKQQSADLIENMETMQLSQQPWTNNQSDMQRYNFVGPTSQQSPQQQQQQQWGGNNKSHSSTTLNNGSPGALSPNHSLSPAPSLQSVIAPLPHGWEMSLTPDGEIYYINHVEKTTSWFHPSLPPKNQQGPIKLNQLHVQHQVAITQHISQNQQQQAVATAAALAQQQQQQQQQQPTPVSSPQQQAPQMSSPVNNVGGSHALPRHTGNGMGNKEAFIHAELQKLQKEKDALRRQQEEIAKKEQHLLTRNFGPNSTTPLTTAGTNPLGMIEENPPINSQSNSSQESQLAMLKEGSQHNTMVSGQPVATNSTTMHAISTSGVDPFLGQTHSNSAVSHAKSNSADSGLGMGNNYSLPRTPEDYLSNVDEMDSTEAGGLKGGAKVQSSDFNMNDMDGMGMDVVSGMSNTMDTRSTPMEEHDLISTLPDDISSELLDGQKIDNLLTWL